MIDFDHTGEPGGDLRFYRPAAPIRPARPPMAVMLWELLRAIAAVVLMTAVFFCLLFLSGCQTFQEPRQRPTAAYDDTGPSSVHVRVWPPTMQRPGEGIVTVRVSGDLPDCGRLTLLYGDGSHSTHEACPPERHYRRPHYFRAVGQLQVTAYFQGSDGRTVSDSAALLILGSQ